MARLSVLGRGQQMNIGDRLVSPNGKCQLIFQDKLARNLEWSGVSKVYRFPVVFDPGES